MTRVVVRLTGVVLLGCIVIVLLARAAGNVLPPENEILLTAVLGENDLDIYRMALTRHTIVLLTRSPADEFQAAWSPDGEQIVFVSNRSGSSAIYTMDAVGTSVRRLTEGQIGDYNPSWSPDGRQIAFATDRYPTSRELLLYDLDNGTTRRLTNDSNLDNNPTWSIDHNQIIFSSVRNNNQSNLYNLNLTNGNPTSLMLPPDNYLNPVWSPNGRYVLYQVLSATPGLYIWDTFEKRIIRNLASLSFTGQTVDWSPDNRYIIYSNLIEDQYTGIFRMDVPICIEQPTNCIPERIASFAGRYFNPRWRPHQP